MAIVPILSIEQVKPLNSTIESPLPVLSGVSPVKPSITFVQNTTNIFTETDNTWSDADIPWSDASAVWGGLDPKSADRPIFDRIDSVRPQLIR